MSKYFGILLIMNALISFAHAGDADIKSQYESKKVLAHRLQQSFVGKLDTTLERSKTKSILPFGCLSMAEKIDAETKTIEAPAPNEFRQVSTRASHWDLNKKDADLDESQIEQEVKRGEENLSIKVKRRDGLFEVHFSKFASSDGIFIDRYYTLIRIFQHIPPHKG